LQEEDKPDIRYLTIKHGDINGVFGFLKPGDGGPLNAVKAAGPLARTVVAVLEEVPIASAITGKFVKAARDGNLDFEIYAIRTDEQCIRKGLASKCYDSLTDLVQAKAKGKDAKTWSMSLPLSHDCARDIASVMFYLAKGWNIIYTTGDKAEAVTLKWLQTKQAEGVDTFPNGSMQLSLPPQPIDEVRASIGSAWAFNTAAAPVGGFGVKPASRSMSCSPSLVAAEGTEGGGDAPEHKFEFQGVSIVCQDGLWKDQHLPIVSKIFSTLKVRDTFYMESKSICEANATNDEFNPMHARSPSFTVLRIDTEVVRGKSVPIGVVYARAPGERPDYVHAVKVGTGSFQGELASNRVAAAEAAAAKRKSTNDKRAATMARKAAEAAAAAEAGGEEASGEESGDDEPPPAAKPKAAKAAKATKGKTPPKGAIVTPLGKKIRPGVGSPSELKKKAPPASMSFPNGRPPKGSIIIGGKTDARWKTCPDTGKVDCIWGRAEAGCPRCRDKGCDKCNNEAAQYAKGVEEWRSSFTLVDDGSEEEEEEEEPAAAQPPAKKQKAAAPVPGDDSDDSDDSNDGDSDDDSYSQTSDGKAELARRARMDDDDKESDGEEEEEEEEEVVESGPTRAEVIATGVAEDAAVEDEETRLGKTPVTADDVDAFGDLFDSYFEGRCGSDEEQQRVKVLMLQAERAMREAAVRKAPASAPSDDEDDQPLTRRKVGGDKAAKAAKGSKAIAKPATKKVSAAAAAAPASVLSPAKKSLAQYQAAIQAHVEKNVDGNEHAKMAASVKGNSAAGIKLANETLVAPAAEAAFLSLGEPVYHLSDGDFTALLQYLQQCSLSASQTGAFRSKRTKYIARTGTKRAAEESPSLAAKKPKAAAASPAAASSSSDGGKKRVRSAAFD